MGLHWALVLAFGIAGAGITQSLTYQFLSVAEIFRWDNWQFPCFAGGTAGAIVGHFVWVMSKPRQRASFAAVICALANVLVWMSFLALGTVDMVRPRQRGCHGISAVDSATGRRFGTRGIPAHGIIRSDLFRDMRWTCEFN
jgi:hypothetical protein